MLIPSSRPRSGFTLVELLVSLVLASLVGAALVGVLMRQQRFYDGAARIVEVRDNVRDVTGLVPSDLRALSRAEGDIYAMSDTSIDFRLAIGGGVVCSIDLGRLAFRIPPKALGTQASLTYWSAQPLAGDSVFVLDNGGTKKLSDDVWRAYELSADADDAQTCPTSSGFTKTAGEAAAGYLISVVTPLAASIQAGAPVRFFRRAHYALYREASGNWYLGYFDCPGGDCATIEAVSGPFMPYKAGAAGGIGFTYYDSTGATTATRTQVSRIRFAARAATVGGVSRAGETRGADLGDSLVVSISLRNRH
jgi:prepilin-type N-terminal cleavage/methylation domain-containing protein